MEIFTDSHYFYTVTKADKLYNPRELNCLGTFDDVFPSNQKIRDWFGVKYITKKVLETVNKILVLEKEMLLAYENKSGIDVKRYCFDEGFLEYCDCCTFYNRDLIPKYSFVGNYPNLSAFEIEMQRHQVYKNLSRRKQKDFKTVLLLA